MLLERQPIDENPATAWVIDQLDRHGCLVRGTGSGRTGRKVAVLGRIAGPGLPDIEELLGAAGCRHRLRAGRRGRGGRARSRRAAPRTARSTAPEQHQPCRRTAGGRGCRDRPVRRTRQDRLPALHRRAPERARSPPRRGDHALRRGHCSRATRRAVRPRRPGAGRASPWPGRCATSSCTSTGDSPRPGPGRCSCGPDPTQRREDTWLRHPMCACCWADDALARTPVATTATGITRPRPI